GLTPGTSATLTVLGLQLSGNYVIEKSTTASGQPVVKIGMSQVGLTLGGGFVTVTNGQGVILLLPPQVTGKAITASPTATRLTVTDHGLITGDKVKYVRGGGGAVISGLTDGSVYFVRKVDDHTIELLATATSTEAIPVTFVATAGTTHTLLKANGQFFGTPVAGSGGIAGSISASVDVNVPGVTFNGNFALKINTTNRAVIDSLTVGGVPLAINLPTGPYLRVEGTGIQLTVAGVTLAGNFAFERSDPDGTPNNADDRTVVALSNVSINLGGVLEVFNGQGVFLITSTGIAGRLAISVRANFGGAVQLGGTVQLELNQTGAAVTSTTVKVGGVAQTIAFADATRLLRVTLTGIGGDPAFLEIAGQRLTAASFMFEQQAAKGPDNLLGTADDVRVLRVSASGVGLNLGNGLVVVTGGALAIEVTPAGVAGVVRATVTIGAAGSVLAPIFSVTTTVTISINQRTTEARFDRSWLDTAIGAGNVTDIFGSAADAPTPTIQAGKYLRVEAKGISVDVLGGVAAGGFSLTADFAFEQSTTPGADRIAGNADDEKVVRVGVANLHFVVVAGVLSISGGSGLLLLTPRGMAADFSVTPTFTLSGIQFTGTFRLAINQVKNAAGAGIAVDETFVVGDTALRLNLPAGPYLKIEGTGVQLSIANGAFLLRGNFAIEKAGTTLRITLSQVELRLGDGTTDYVIVTNGQGTLVSSPDGVTGDFSASVVVQVPGITVGTGPGGSFGVHIDTRATATTPLEVSGSNVFVEAFGQRLSGSFKFSKFVDLGADGAVGGTTPQNLDRTFIKIGITDLRIALGDGTRDIVVIGGYGAIIVGKFMRPCPTPATPTCQTGQTQLVSGVAGQFVVTLNLVGLPEIGFTGNFQVKLNTTGTDVHQIVSVRNNSGNDVNLRIDVARDLTIRIEGGVTVDANNNGTPDMQPVSLTIAGQTLSIDTVYFDQSQTAAGTKIIKLAITGARLALSDGASVIATIGPIDGAFMLTAQGVAGRLGIGPTFIELTDDVAIAWASASIEINQTPNAIHQTFGGQTLDLLAGK
ncbi:MAG TPA: hypothetical protein VF065_10915, partial [Ilumatobacter sp.]